MMAVTLGTWNSPGMGAWGVVVVPLWDFNFMACFFGIDSPVFPGTPSGKLFFLCRFPRIPRLYHTKVLCWLCHKLWETRVGLTSPFFLMWMGNWLAERKSFPLPLGFLLFLVIISFKNFLLPFHSISFFFNFSLLPVTYSAAYKW